MNDEAPDRPRQDVAAGQEPIARAQAADLERLRALAATRLALTAAVAARNEVLRRLGEAERRSLELEGLLKKAREEGDRLHAALRDCAADRAAVHEEREQALQELQKALFLGSARGLARRAAVRPLIQTLSASSRISRAVGMARLSARLKHDADLLRSRRYREWHGLLRSRLARVVRGVRSRVVARPRSETADTETASTVPASDAIRRAELDRIAISPPPSTDRRRPMVVVVVPWLLQGGSETVLLDILKALSTFVDIGIVTTQRARHTNADLFESFVREVHHLQGDLQQDEVTDFLVAFCRTRQARILFSSNADVIYKGAGTLKAAHPQLTTIDLLHNDFREGHFASAVAAAPFIDRQIVVAPHIATALGERGLEPDKIVTIRNGIDTDATFDPTLTTPRDGRHFLDMEEGGFVLGFVGRMSPEKRPLAFLDIVEALGSVPELRVVMVGSGPLDAEVDARLATLGRPVVWRRHLDRSNMAFVYAAIDVLVVPSTVEGMPLAVLEAMAMGVPVAATDVGNIRQIVDHGASGFIVEVDRYMDLADPISAMAKDPRHRIAMGLAARRTIIVKGFTRSAMIDGYEATFREALGAAIGA